MTWPTVTEHPLRLEPTSRDPFLDGLGDIGASASLDNDRHTASSDSTPVYHRFVEALGARPVDR